MKYSSPSRNARNMFHVLKRAWNEPVTAGLQVEQTHFTPSPSLAICCTVCYHPNRMTAYTIPRTTATTLSQEVAARKAARRKIIERARRLEADSYKAMMQRRRQLQTSYQLDTIA